MKKSNCYKRLGLQFLLIQAGISFSVGFAGSILDYDKQISYLAFLVPFVMAAICMIPIALLYTDRQLTVKQAIIRKVLLLLIIECIILTVQKICNPNTSFSRLILISITVVIIYLFIHWIMWISSQKEADNLNERIVEFRNKNNS